MGSLSQSIASLRMHPHGLNWVVLCLTCLLGCNREAEHQSAQSRNASTTPHDAPQNATPATTSDEGVPLPVILLTGFEPFGPGRPPNASWEAIAPLNDRQWHDYRLVCKQMRVVWGAPREQLTQWISEYRPVAVFAFGQGLAGSFALESRASNTRGAFPDNEQALPSAPIIIADGPAELQATSDCQSISRLLKQKGYPVRISNDAGEYLCEETLYCLEYLKQQKQIEAVTFCHVPPLGSHIKQADDGNDRVVTPEYVERFIEDFLESWRTANAAHITGSDTSDR